MTQAPLEARGAAKRFGAVEALRGVDLVVQPGELVAVMGPSGSGKSTLLHVLAGLTPADAGEVRVDGQPLAGLTDEARTLLRRRRIGLLFQAGNLLPALTAAENVGLPALADGKDDPARVDALLERLGLRAERDRRPDQLSGGQQQRVALARALVAGPAVLLCDEPTGNLDTAAGQAVARLLVELCREERCAVVVVTHEPAIAAHADRVVVLRDGRVAATLERPASAQALAAAYLQATA